MPHLRDFLRPPDGRSMSDAEFARQCGVAASTVTRWREGEMMPDRDGLLAIRAATGGLVTADDMLDGLKGRASPEAAA